MKKLLALCLLLYMAGLYQVLMERHERFPIELDSASVSQIVWLMNHGLPLNGTILGKPMLGEHFCPAFLALVPLVRGLDPFQGLIVLQVLCSGLVLCMAYGLARQMVDPVPATLATAGLAFGPLLIFIFLYPTPFLGLGLAGILLHYWGAFTVPSVQGRMREWLGILLAATCYEPCMLPIIGLGLYRIVTPGRRREGLLVTIVAAAIMLTLIAVVVPHFAGVTQMDQTKRYSYLLEGKLPPAIAENPGLAASTVAFMLLAGGWLVVSEPALFLTILPGSAVNFLSTLKFCYSISLNYQAYYLPGLFLMVLRALQKYPGRRRPLAGFCLFTSLASWGLCWRLYEPIVYSHDSLIAVYREALAQIPAEASVLAPSVLGSHLTDRQEIHIYPGNGLAARRLTDWMILDMSAIYLERVNPSLHTLFTRDFCTEAEFQVRWRCGALVVLQRGPGDRHLVLPELNPIVAGERYRVAGLHARAAQYFGLAAQAAGQDAELWMVHASELEQSGDKEGAKASYRKALDCPNLDPQLKPQLEWRLKS